MLSLYILDDCTKISIIYVADKESSEDSSAVIIGTTFVCLITLVVIIGAIVLKVKYTQLKVLTCTSVCLLSVCIHD